MNQKKYSGSKDKGNTDFICGGIERKRIEDSNVNDVKIVKSERDSIGDRPPQRRPSCYFCCQIFNDTSDEYRMHLLSHLEAYSGKTVCPRCLVNCCSHEKMIDHFLMVHGGVEKLICFHSNCVRSFRTRKTLQLHAKKHVNWLG